MDFPERSFLFHMLIVFLVLTGPSFSVPTDDIAKSEDSEAASLSVVNTSCIIEGVKKDFEKFLVDNEQVLASAKLVDDEDESSSSPVSETLPEKTSKMTSGENISESTSEFTSVGKGNEPVNYENVRLFMRRMLQLPQDRSSNPAEFDRGNFIKATYVTYHAAEYLYSFILCRLHYLSNSPYLESPKVYQITRLTLDACGYAGSRLTFTVAAFYEVIADDLKSLLSDDEPYSDDSGQPAVSELASPSTVTKAPVLHEEMPSRSSKIETLAPVIHSEQPIRPTSTEKETRRNCDSKFFKNIHFGISDYTFLKTIRVLYEVIGQLLTAFAHTKDLVNMVTLRPEVRSAIPEDAKNNWKISFGSDDSLHDKEYKKLGLGSSKTAAGESVRRGETKPLLRTAKGQTNLQILESGGPGKVNEESETSPPIEETPEDVQRLDANEKIFWEAYSMIHDDGFIAHGKYLREYFARINVDVGPFDLHGNIVGDLVSEDGDSVVKYNSFQLTIEMFTWRNAAEIMRISDFVDSDTGHASKLTQNQISRFGNMHPFKLLALLEEYRNAMNYKLERPSSTLEQPFAELLRNVPYPDTEVVWNMENEHEPDFKFIIKN